MTQNDDPPRVRDEDRTGPDGTDSASLAPSAGGPRRVRFSAGRKLLFTFITVVFLIGLTEVGLRVSYRVWKGTWDFLPRTRFASELYEPHPYICYVMRPNVELAGYGGKVCTNRWGLRGRDVERRKPQGVVRIACLGGSTTFSLDASDNDHTWPAQLERLLNKRHAPTRFEVLNFGTPGYCAIESFLIFALRGLDFDPDIVLIHDAWNDTGAVFRADLTSDYTHHRGFYTRLGGGWLAKTAIGRLVLLAAPRFGCIRRQGPHYPSDEGPELFVRYVESTILLARPRGIEPVIVTIPDRLPADPAQWKGLNVQVASARWLIRSLRRLRYQWDVPVIDLAASFPKGPEYFTDAVHKTNEGLELAARMIADGLEENRVLSRVLEGGRSGQLH